MISKAIFDDIDNLPDEYLVVGVSAGPDSMALLHMLMHNTHKKLICTHINHNVRPTSNEEENYLKLYCKENNLVFESMKIDKYTQSNFENEAREKRYQFYEQILHKYHSHFLLLAHHGDDLIETVLMKITRGSNLEGYAGIKTYSKQKDYVIIRPLLNLTKEDLIIYNKENNIKYYIDDSNDDITYTRNRYRKHILPLLKQEDPQIHLKYLKYSNTLQAYYNYVEEVTQKIITKNYQNNTIDIAKFNLEHPFIQKNIIFHLLSKLYQNQTNIIKDSHIEAIIKLMSNDKPNIVINLPNDYIAKRSYNYIHIEKYQNKVENYKIKLKDNIKIGNMIIKKSDNITTDGNDVCRLNSKTIKLPLYLRNKKNGDYIEPLNLDGKQKIKDIFIDHKIPLDLRNNYPLLVDADDNILWIPNIKKSKYNVKKDEFYDIILTSYKESEEHNEKETK